MFYTAVHFNRLLLSLIVFFSVLLFTNIYYEQRFAINSNAEYFEIAKQNKQLLDTMIKAKQEKVTLMALSLANDEALKASLLKQNSEEFNFDNYVYKVARYSNLKNIWIHIIDSDGKSVFRTWSDQKGDDVVAKRSDLQRFFSEPQVLKSISVGKFDLTFKTIVPIYEKGQLIGAFEVIAKFNSITEVLANKGFASVILVDESYQEQLTEPFTKRFMEGSYIANLNADDRLVKVIKSHRIDKNVGQGALFFVIEEINQFVSFKHIYDVDNHYLATHYLFQPLQPILDRVNGTAVVINGYLTGIYLLIIAIYLAWFHMKNSERATKFNRTLKSAVRNKEEALEDQAYLWQHVIDGLDDTVLVIDKNYQIKQMNQAARNFSADKELKLCGNPHCYELIFDQNSPCDMSQRTCPLRKCFKTGKPATIVQELKSPNGEMRFFEFTTTPLVNKDGTTDKVIEIGHDITPYLHAKNELELQKDKLDYMAYHDSLTDLPNRLLFLDRLQQSIDHSLRSKQLVGLLFIDLDRFKEINDTFGHKMGDKVLEECAKRLQNATRASDTVSRLGGDEFTVIVDQLECSESVLEVVKNILSALSAPCHIYENTFHLTASIGISVYPNDGQTIHDLLKNADIAMYQAKADGRDSYAFYNSEMTRKAVERLHLEEKIRKAINENQLVMFYQPQYDVNTHQITGFEALVRWNDPEKGIIYPADFIPLAEETGLIMPIGDLVMKMAMSTIAEWHRKGITTKRVAINVSAKQFKDKDLLENVAHALELSDCKPEWVELEITESSVMENHEYAISVLEKLQEMGITVSIDDFGTGYSSLAQLKRMPINKLKIDQSFVHNLPQNHEDGEITKAIIAMAKSLNIDMIAEGIETHEQSDFINAQGCSNAQGYLYGYPADKLSIEAMLVASKAVQ